VKFDVLSAVVKEIRVFRDVTMWRLVNSYRRFGGSILSSYSVQT